MQLGLRSHEYRDQKALAPEESNVSNTWQGVATQQNRETDADKYSGMTPQSDQWNAPSTANQHQLWSATKAPNRTILWPGTQLL